MLESAVAGKDTNEDLISGVLGEIQSIKLKNIPVSGTF
jgi:hypothetical protein